MEYQIDKKLTLNKRLIDLLDKTKIKDSYISSICEKYISLMNEGVKAHSIVENLISELSQFDHNSDVDSFVNKTTKIINENSCTYTVAKFIKNYGLSGNNKDSEFYKRLDRFANQMGEKELTNEIKYGSLNFYGEIIPEFKSIVEMAYANTNENPSLANANITVPVVPIIESGEGFVFYLNGQNFYYEPQNESLSIHNGLPEDKLYGKLVESSKIFKLSKREAKFVSKLSNTVIKVKYSEGTPIVEVNGKEYEYNDKLRDNLYYICNLYNESYVVNATMFLAENFHRFVELDFSEMVVNNVNENKTSTYFKLKNSTVVINHDKETQERNIKNFDDINECVHYINSWTGYNVYESLDNMFGSENADTSDFKKAKIKLLGEMSKLMTYKQKIENSGMINESLELKSIYDSVETKIQKVKARILKLNETLGIKQSFEEDTFSNATVIGRFRSVPVGATVKVNESSYKVALKENPIEAWLDGEKIFIPKKFLSL